MEIREITWNITHWNKQLLSNADQQTRRIFNVYQPEIQIEGTAHDGAGIDSIEIYLDNIFIQKAQGTSNWRLELAITTGRHGIQLKMVNPPDKQNHNEYLNITLNYCWIQGPALNYVRNFHSTVIFNNELYLLGGGADIQPIMEKYNPVARTWELSPVENLAWNKFQAACDDQYIYIHGGNLNDSWTGDLARINPLTGMYENLASGGLPKAMHGLVYYDGNLISFGGYDVDNALYYSQIEIYDIANNLWLPPQSLPLALGIYGYVKAANKVYIVGGVANNLIVRNLYVLDLDTLTLSLLPTQLPETLRHASAAFYEGRLYITGGSRITAESTDYANNTSREVYIYDLKTNKWSTGEPMKQDRSQHASVVLGNNLYITGGISREITNALKSTEVYQFD